MDSSLPRWMRSLTAVFLGYLVIALGTFFFFEVVLGGIGWQQSSYGELSLATAGAAISGLAGGLAAAVMAGRRFVAHGVALAIPLALDTASVILGDKSVDPLWFDIGGASLLLVGGVVGAWLWGQRRKGDRRPALGRA